MRVIRLEELIADARFGEQLSLHEFVRPSSYPVVSLYKSITSPNMPGDQVVLSCWEWISKNIRYSSDTYKMKGPGFSRSTDECFLYPAETIAFKSGDCDCSSILMASLLRNKFPSSDTYVAIGDLATSRSIGGHAWVTINRYGQDYIIETTLNRMPEVPWKTAGGLIGKYRPKVYFNDQEIWAVSDNIELLPQSNCDINWMNEMWCGCRI